MSIKTICFEKEKVDWAALRSKVLEDLNLEHEILLSSRLS